MISMIEATQQETADMFLGSGALVAYPWWGVSDWHLYPKGSVDAYDGWHVLLFDATADDATRTRKVTHDVIVATVRRIAEASDADARDMLLHPDGDTVRECRTFLSDPDDADFDAGSADCVLQVAVWGRCDYS